MKSKDVGLCFDEGSITSDAGLSVIIDWMRGQPFIQAYADILEPTDERREDRIDHTILQLLRPRVFPIVAGYEDANDID